ncbi:hypothetical protein Bamb_1887 [Burkholderia ambifaria AMMD]|uniref:Uncharacterized protein n=1 Tax=Burkholderia ambifaria (strain ATCC BAA-244 / DSM 16087 / CCUG 44356 / LMG 19182 / AMMD) TaxID=339670 RepID=Q0BEI0_BURCM|nr:hypothetical protein Bamb_1887 [Burkholderia ambifaria AMMD]
MTICLITSFAPVRGSSSHHTPRYAVVFIQCFGRTVSKRPRKAVSFRVGLFASGIGTVPDSANVNDVTQLLPRIDAIPPIRGLRGHPLHGTAFGLCRSRPRLRVTSTSVAQSWYRAGDREVPYRHSRRVPRPRLRSDAGIRFTGPADLYETVSNDTNTYRAQLS